MKCMCMKCIIVLRENEAIIEKELREILADRGFQTEVMLYGKIPGHQLYQNIVSASPDFIITVDLTGFEMLTDTDDIAFINLTFPSINIITKRMDLKSLACLTKKLSIAMFFYCEKQETYDYLIEKCPEIPYLKLVGKWEEAVDDMICKASME